jgi:ABC-type iron transport system FetAB ATPase subunit
MHFISSGFGSWYNLPRGQGIAYAAQESWIQNETIRDNILFGAFYDEERYEKGGSLDSVVAETTDRKAV